MQGWGLWGKGWGQGQGPHLVVQSPCYRGSLSRTMQILTHPAQLQRLEGILRKSLPLALPVTGTLLSPLPCAMRGTPIPPLPHRPQGHPHLLLW